VVGHYFHIHAEPIVGILHRQLQNTGIGRSLPDMMSQITVLSLIPLHAIEVTVSIYSFLIRQDEGVQIDVKSIVFGYRNELLRMNFTTLHCQKLLELFGNIKGVLLIGGDPMSNWGCHHGIRLAE
jgi:hypothetical protein